MSKGKFRKVMLHLDTEDMEWMESVYGRTLGVSGAVRKLIAGHRQRWLKAKEVMEVKNDTTGSTTGVGAEQADEA